MYMYIYIYLSIYIYIYIYERMHALARMSCIDSARTPLGPRVMTIILYHLFTTTRAV